MLVIDRVCVWNIFIKINLIINFMISGYIWLLLYDFIRTKWLIEFLVHFCFLQ